MTRYRKALIAPVLLAAAIGQPSQAHAFGLASLFGFLSGYWAADAAFGGETGTLNGGLRG